MDQELYQQIMEEYRLQRQEDAREEQRRRDELREREPELFKLTQERHSIVLSFCSQAVAGTLTGSPEEALRQLNQRVRSALKQKGYPEDYLEPVYRCKKCRDTGVMGDVIKRDCDCLREKLLRRTASVSNMTESFEAFDLNVFPNTVPEGLNVTQREHMRLRRDACEKYANDFPAQQPRDLLIYGQSGLGKSYLLCCVWRRLRERGFDAELISAYDAIRILRDAFFGREDRTDRLFRPQALLIDDLGMEPMMEGVTIEQLFHLINTRRSRGLAMVISTNLTMNELKKRYTERIASRLLDVSLCRVMRVQGQDVRGLRTSSASPAGQTDTTAAGR